MLQTTGLQFSTTVIQTSSSDSTSRARAACEREHLEDVLRRTGWNFADRLLGIRRTTCTRRPPPPASSDRAASSELILVPPFPRCPAPSYLTVRFADGDNAPLPAVDVAAWRRGDALFFAWPGPGKVQLLAGARDLTAPTYDLSALAEVLPLRPAQIAELDLTGEGLKEGVPPRWARWVIPAALAFAALSLLALLRRILSEQAPPR